MISKFPDVFSEKPSTAKSVVHSIRTTEGCIVRDHWRQLLQDLWRIVKQEITQMLEADIIEESQSLCRSHLVIVPKSDRTIWVCVDFRMVNKVTTFDASPMPPVEEMLEKISQAKYIFLHLISQKVTGKYP